MDFGIVSQAISSSFYVSGTVVGSKGKKKVPNWNSQYEKYLKWVNKSTKQETKKMDKINNSVYIYIDR